MWLRRAFFGWLIPAAFLLPLWLLVGWGVFDAGGWAFVWVIFLAIPGVFVWQLILTLLVRARGTVRAHRAVSWWDVLGFTVWHGLVISLGFFARAWWAPVMVLTILVGVGLFWLALWQLWREAKPSVAVLRTTEGYAYIPPTEARTESAQPEVIILSEKQSPGA
ncbi:MFS transporter permease [Microbacterium sp. 2FI]|uniref:MFS transporter permease n=1 Tax=Microbacterium sp. 2FI TaxID=2502193 RepID=UPI0010F711DC|nr:MFS transporter permease [Microbacterium sp. 2FI]